MKVLIVGRSGVGKDTLREELETSYGWKFVKSKTTRAPRFKGEDTHQFVTRKQADSDDDKVAVTYIENTITDKDIYYASRSDVNDCDGYIVDPVGMFQLLCNMPDTDFMLVYLRAKESDRRKFVKKRNGQKGLVGMLNRLIRFNSENHEFGVLDEIVDNNIRFRNLKVVISLFNTYRPRDIPEFATVISQSRLWQLEKR